MNKDNIPSEPDAVLIGDEVLALRGIKKDRYYWMVIPPCMFAVKVEEEPKSFFCTDYLYGVRF